MSFTIHLNKKLEKHKDKMIEEIPFLYRILSSKSMASGITAYKKS